MTACLHLGAPLNLSLSMSMQLVATKDEVVELETTNPAIIGEMTITFTLTDRCDGTKILALHKNLPAGVAPTENQFGWRMSLAKPALLFESNRYRSNRDSVD